MLEGISSRGNEFCFELSIYIIPRSLGSGGDKIYPRHRGFRAAADDDDDDDDDDDSQLQHVARRVIRAAEKHLAEFQRITPTLPKNRQKMMLQTTRSPTENCIPLDMFVHNL